VGTGFDRNHAPLSSPTLGNLLRSLREARGLSPDRLARDAGVDPKTIRNWEGEKFSPRLPELQLVLTTLGATDTQCRQVLELLRRPRAMAHIALVPNARVPVAQGDLLRAMRVRRNRSLEEVAARVGVATRTLSRWERGERMPDVQYIKILCQVLDAAENEVAALTLGTDFTGADSPPLDVLWEQFRAFHTYPLPPETVALQELTYISLALRLQPLTWQDLAARELLSQVYTMLAHLYYLEGRPEKTLAFAERALLLFEGVSTDSNYTALALIRYTNVRPAPMANLNLLKRWKSCVKDVDTKAWILGQQAYLLADLKMNTEADKYSLKAVRLGDSHGCGGDEGRYMMRANLLSRLNQHDRAISMLSPIPLTETSHPDIPLVWAKVLLAKRDYEGAQQMVERAVHQMDSSVWSDYRADIVPFLRRQVETIRRAIFRRQKKSV
jgi:transcriptional regulator with XRE-family HTH domain